MNRWFLFFLFMLWPALSMAAEFSAKITLSRDALTVNEILSVTVVVSHPGGYDVDIDKMRSRLLQYSGMVEPPFVLSSEKITNTNETEKTVIFSLRPQFEGIFFLSLYDIVFSSQDQQKEPFTILSDIFQVDVSLPQKSEQSIELYPLLSLSQKFPISMTEENRRTLFQSQDPGEISALLKEKTPPWIQIFSALFLLFLIPILRLQPKKERFAMEQKQKATTPNELLKALERLEIQHLAKNQEAQNYYIELSAIFKQYIEQTYGITATTQTSLELTDSFRKNSKISPEQKRIFKHVFETADRIKFAHEQPELDAAQKVAGIVKEIL